MKSALVIPNHDQMSALKAGHRNDWKSAIFWANKCIENYQSSYETRKKNLGDEANRYLLANIFILRAQNGFSRASQDRNMNAEMRLNTFVQVIDDCGFLTGKNNKAKINTMLPNCFFFTKFRVNSQIGGTTKYRS
jgi:hypothetical protein